MALSQVYTAIAGDVITAARWNNEFGNIYTNGTDVAFPLTKAVSYAGFTVTYDVAGVSTITSPATQGFLMTIGAKSGTPGPNGGLVTLTASTYTDIGTAASGTAALWAGFSIRTPTLAASAVTVTTTEAATMYVEGAPIAGANETITQSYAALFGAKIKVNGDLKITGEQFITTEDSRTNTVDAPLTVTSTTSGAVANEIGTGILLQAESADENPSNIGQLQFRFSDKTAASEYSYFQIMLRVAGAALSNAYKWIATTAFQAIFTHANTADVTYTLPDITHTLGRGALWTGTSSCGSGSELAHEGTVTINANQALSGPHFYTNFTLDAGKTVTLDNDSDRLIIFATDTITINGTIDGIGAGSPGGGAQAVGANGFSQVGGGGGDGASGTPAAGGICVVHGVTKANGGAAGAGGAGGVGTQLSGTQFSIAEPLSIMGGAGGGGGASTAGGAGGAGGRGGGSVVLVAPKIILGAASAIKTTGGGGSGGSGATGSGGGGGGGAGNYYAFTCSYTDNGCTFTLSGGAGGNGAAGGGFAGGAGRAGLKQINIYA